MNDGDQVQAAPPLVAYPCPGCGATDAWKADYNEAVWQTVRLVIGVGGEPELDDYTGVTGSYDDGASFDEAYRCGNCDETIELGSHVWVEVANVPAVREFLAGLRSA